MKLKFHNQALHQTAAEAADDLFLEQERQQSTFEIDGNAHYILNDLGIEIKRIKGG